MKILLANFTKMIDDTGGLAKVTSAFANEMVKRGHEVSLVYSDEQIGEFFYPVCDEVKCYNLKINPDGTRIKFPVYLKAVRELVRPFGKRAARTLNSWFDERNLITNMVSDIKKINPDVIVTYQPAASKLILCDAKLDIPVITMSHGDPEEYFQLGPKKEIPALLKSDVCQVLMPSYARNLKKHLPEANVVVIGNAIPQFDFSANLNEEKEQYKIIFVGRLAKNHKRPHLLIQAFSKIAAKYPNWIVELWGAQDGAAYFKELEYVIKAAGLKDRILIKGVTDNVPEKLQKADILAFPSAWEGFSLALGEGMSVGLPAIGFKSAPSVNELIIDGETGILSDDGADAFAIALEKLMSDKDLRVKMGEAAKKEMAEFAPENIWNQWEALMKQVVVSGKKS